MAQGIKAGDVIWSIRADDRQFKKTMKNASLGAKKFGDNLQNSLKKASTTFKRFGVVSAVAIGGLIEKSVDFSTAMAEVNTLGIDNLEGLSDAVKSTAREFGLGLTDSVKGAYLAISAGATELEAPLILENAARAATAGVSDLATAIQLGTGTANAFGIELKDMNQVFDAAFIAVKQGSVDFNQLAAGIGKVAPVMKAAGLSADDMFASIAALTKGGIIPAEAFTGLKAAIAGIINPSTTAAKAAERLGLDFSAAGLKAEGWEGMLKKVAEATKGDLDVTKELFSSQEALTAVLALTGEQAGSLADTLDMMADKSGASQEAFDAFVDANPGFIFQQLKSDIEALAIELGDNLAPRVREFVEKDLRPMIDTIIKWSNENPELAAQIGGLSVSAVGLSLALAPLAIVAASVVSIMGTFATGAGIVLTSLIGMGALGATVAVAGITVMGLSILALGVTAVNTAAAHLALSDTINKQDASMMQWLTTLNKAGAAIDVENFKTLKWKQQFDLLTKAQDKNTNSKDKSMKKALEYIGVIDQAVIAEQKKLEIEKLSFDGLGKFIQEQKKATDEIKEATKQEGVLTQADLDATKARRQYGVTVGGASWEQNRFTGTTIQASQTLGNGLIPQLDRTRDHYWRLKMAAAAANAEMAKTPGGGRRADGGAVRGFADGGTPDNNMFLVGERGPELLAIPHGVNGRVMSNVNMMNAISAGERNREFSGGGGGNVTINPTFNITNNGVEDTESLVEKLKGDFHTWLRDELKDALV